METIVTDPQRLEQILKNLLSNAFKFTSKGKITLEIAETSGSRIAFRVRDTGIGIPESQQQLIFEAFRQADGTTNRKYGGTGLGLSISRELARLLGGEIQLQSTPGQGSTFTVMIPRVFDPAKVQPAPVKSYTPVPGAGQSPVHNKPAARPPGLSPVAQSAAKPTVAAPVGAPDDRDQLSNQQRMILVIEDDPAFAQILYDLAHESGFQCILASSAEEGIDLALWHLPSAVILDVGLPDHSGLSVLDRLKHEARTRHIPIHVVSGTDYAQTALSMGAVGYMLKPVKREQLVEAFENLQSRLSRHLRRVLVVEDDAVQLEALQVLLRTQEVETVGARSAKECLEHLKSTTFDCMVLDLSLPDASGFALLETLSNEDTYSFPPVIIYTGRDLKQAEEQQLLKYSKSIIIKGAKSPERLLDEVTLFLHQVVAELAPEQQRMLQKAHSRDATLEGRRVLVVEDDVRNVFAITSILEPRGVKVQIARNGLEALESLEKASRDTAQ
jgi:CheY-like chemotaxis protein/anti-sigma regulatory factor (Ser/Thr protein kinase)